MKSKKYLSIFLSLAMVLGTLTNANAAPSKKLDNLQKPQVNKPVVGKSFSVDSKNKNLKENDEVRIIVELKDKPLIEYATEKGVKVSQLDKKVSKQVKDNLLKTQQDVKNKIKSKNINVKYYNDFVNVASGFSGTTTVAEAEEIEKLPEVQSVSLANEYSRPEPEMTTSKDIVEARQTWDKLGYNGEGMVAAIIDTGIDPSHHDMVLTNPDKAKLQQSEVNAVALQGTYHTAKVPYGYNYMDQNQEILDLGPDASRHGMHVAGIVGANGDETNGGIKGVAPEIQLLAMKVFGNNPAMPSTFGDVIVKAIDDSVALGADVINMSLGSTASFVQSDDLEQMAVNRAVVSGVVVSISAGNSTQFGSGWDNPYTQNPDIGVVGAPGIANDSIQVASVENTNMVAKSLEYVYTDGEDYKAGYMASGPDPVTIFNGQVQYVDCKLGLIGTRTDGTKVDDFAGADVAGKIALIMRGSYADAKGNVEIPGNFVDKIANAQSKGAIGVIVYNNANSGLISMAYPEGGTIPAVFIQQADGQRLLELIAQEKNYVKFNGTTTVVPNPNAGKMSTFTSWGTTPNLDFKPEITAPGGNIWSTDNNNSYQLMSGTSMAAPHVTGGAALVLQRVDKEFNLTGKARVEMAKNLLMSTAKPLGDKGTYNAYYGLGNYNFTSPRRQGAGVMDLYAATTTPVVVVDNGTGLSKVNLKEMVDKSTFTLTVKNFGDKAVSYKVNGTVQTDLTDGEYNYLETQGVYIDGTTSSKKPYTGQFPISFDKEVVEVPAGGSVDLNVTIDLTNAIDWLNNAPLKDIFTNGTFIEGFVRLVDQSDNNPTLSIPYSGFYGEWDKAPIIDATNYDKDGIPFYGYTAMAHEVSPGNYNFLGYDASKTGNPDENNIAFSPNGDGVMDTTIPVLSFLRNAKELDINILDKDGNKIRDLANEEYLTKNYYDSRKNSKYTIHDMWTWDGTANNKIVKDGQYYYEIKARVDYEGSEWQTVKFPVKVDTKSPIMGKVSYDKSTKTLTVEANDGGYPIYNYELIDNGSVVVESLDGKFNLSAVTFTNKAKLRVSDFAGNITIMELASTFKGDSNVATGEVQQPSESTGTATPVVYTEPTGPAAGDKTIPAVMVTSPEFFGTYKTSQLTFTGTINDASSIDYFKINGQNVPFVFNKSTGNWDFTAPITLEDGYHSVNIEARDSAGNEIAFAHKVFIDTMAPVINMTENITPTTTAEAINVKALITDNLPSIKVRVNGNMVTNIAPDWSYFNDLDAAKYELAYEVQLNEGINTIIIEAEDDAGNVTVKEIKINRLKAKNK